MTHFKYFILIAILPLFATCNDPGVIAFQEGSQVKWAGLENVAPGSTTKINNVTSLGNWNLEFLTLSPNGGILAIGLRRDQNVTSGVLDTKVIVFNIYQNVKLAEWDESDFKQLIENNANLSYPGQLVDFNPRNLSWMNNNELLINIQPIIAGTGIEPIPQDVALVVDYRNGNLTQGPDFYDRTAASPITAPNHPQKTAFTSENRNGTVYVDGKVVNGLPTDINLFDFVYLGS
jgi:hypothetical protein